MTDGLAAGVGAPYIGLLAAVVAASVTAGACPCVIGELRRRQILDVEGDRTSHQGAVPRGGGLAILAGLVVGLGISWRSWVDGSTLAVVVAAAALAIVGLWDDLVGLRATTRLAVQSAIGLGAAVALVMIKTSRLSPSALGVIGVLFLVTWLVTFVNAFNFMDGINGISAATTVVIGCSLALASLRWEGEVHVLALAMVGASLAFAPFNATNRIFLGDVGSYLLGGGLALVAALGIANGIPPTVVILPFGLYLGDVVFTLVRRSLRGAPLMQAHREHVYQRLANESGWGHGRTTALVIAMTGVLTLLGHVGGGAGWAEVAMVAAGAAVVLAYLGLPSAIGGGRNDITASAGDSSRGPERITQRVLE